MYRSGKDKNQKAAVLLLAVWILTVLTLLALSAGHRGQKDIELTGFFLKNVSNRVLLLDGLLLALHYLQEDSTQEASLKFDNLLWCGISPNHSPEELFKKISFPEGEVGIQTVAAGRIPQYGFEDEERKLNLNAVTILNQNVFKEFLLEHDVLPKQAQQITAEVLAWKTPLSDSAERLNSAMDGQSLFIKRRPFDVLEELLLLPSMELKIFENIKSELTVFPKDTNRIAINFNTATENVLLALARSLTGEQTNTEIPDAQGVVQKILAYRKGPDGQESTADDGLVQNGVDFAFNPSQAVLWSAMQSYQISYSRYFRFNILAVDLNGQVDSAAQVVVDRNNLTLLDWQGGY